MKIGELFETPVQQRIEPVVKLADLADEQLLADELGSTVVTDLIEAFIDELLDGYACSFAQPRTDIGAWISGPFGSGKSHLAKVLALLARGEPLLGQSVAERFLARLPQRSERRARVAENLERMGRGHSGVLACNLGLLGDAKPRPLGQVLLTELYRWCGYTGNFLYARAIEAELDRRGKLAELHRIAAARAEASVAEIQRNPAFYQRPLSLAACELAPELFDSPGAVTQALEHVRDGEPCGAGFLVTTALERLDELERKLERPCRMMFVLDETSAWLAADPARLGELQALAEQAAARGRGRLWVVVVAHSELSEIAAPGASHHADTKSIESRFRHRLTLTTDNIGQVVERRLLRKTAAGERQLASLYAARGGAIRELGEPSGCTCVLPDCDEKRFVRHYPWLPYQLPWVVEVVRSLRTKAGHSELLAGSTRTLLGVVQDVLRDGRRPYLDQPLGELVSFDEVYANLAAEGELPVDQRAELERVGERATGATELTARVAEVLILLGELADVPSTADNVARLLVRRTDDDLTGLLASVQPELDRLTDAKLASRMGTHYEWLTGFGRAFEDEVTQSAQRLGTEDRQRRFDESFVRGEGKERLAEWLGLTTVSFAGERFGFRLRIDGRSVAGRRGDVCLNVTTPVAEDAARRTLGELELESLQPAARLTLFVHCDRDRELGLALDRLVALRQVIRRWVSEPKREGPQQQLARQRERYEVPGLEREVLDQLADALRRASLVFRGASRRLEPRPSEAGSAALRRAVEACWPSIYPKFERVPVVVRHEAAVIEELLAGRRPGNASVAALHLFDGTGQLKLASPLLDGIYTTLRAAPGPGGAADGWSGRELSARLTAPPYGWDPKTIRVGVAALVRAGRLAVVVAGQPIDDPARPELRRTLSQRRSFDEAVLRVREQPPDGEELTEARAFLVRLTRRRGIDETSAAISAAAARLAERVLATAEALMLWSEGAARPLPDEVRSAVTAWARLAAIGEPERRVSELHGQQSELEAGWQAIQAAVADLPPSAAQIIERLVARLAGAHRDGN